MYTLAKVVGPSTKIFLSPSDTGCGQGSGATSRYPEESEAG